MKVLIRTASIDDSKDIWSWRNDPDTIKNSNSDNAVGWVDHEVWFERMLASSDHEILVGLVINEQDTLQKIGMVRFDSDVDAQYVVCSINLNPNWRGRGLSGPLLGSAIKSRSLKTEWPIYAEVKPENRASIKCFEKNMFKLQHRTETVNQYILYSNN